MFGYRTLLHQIRKKKKRKPHKTNPKNPNSNQNQDSSTNDAFSLKASYPSQNYGVQPLGNFYLTSSPHNSRNTGLGNIQTLTDELVLDILGFLSATHLGILSTVSKSFYVFCNHEPLWRNLVLEHCVDNNGFVFKGSWKATYVAECYKDCFDVLKVGSLGFKVQDFYSDYLFQSWLCANLEMKHEWLERDNIVRRKGISVDEFAECFEAMNKPVLLEGCLDDWPAVKKWDRDYLVEVCGDARFAVGPTQMKLMDYFVYSDQAQEERPLYLFDPKFVNKVPRLGQDYEVPVYFREDLFSVLGDERPDYRWIIIGPAGSGSSFHIDPNSTSAWNAVVKGSKKWVLFPPDVVPPGVYPSSDGAEVACPVSITEWFMNFYESTKTWKKKPVECVCKAGEVIFVPNGWWHLVINLEDSIAITQNFVSRRNLLNVLDFLKKPNASTLVSGTRDRVNLHDKFKKAIEASFPGAIDEQEHSRITQRHSKDVLEDITVALGQKSNENPHKSMNNEVFSSEMNRSIERLVELIEGLKLSGKDDSSETPTGYTVRVLQWKTSELGAVLETFLQSCANLLSGKAEIETFAKELTLTLEWIVNHCFSIQDVSSMRHEMEKHFDWDETHNESDADKLQLKEETKNLKDDLERIELEKVDLEQKLESKISKSEAMAVKLMESEKIIQRLETEVELLKQQKDIIEDQMNVQMKAKEDLDEQLIEAIGDYNDACKIITSDEEMETKNLNEPVLIVPESIIEQDAQNCKLDEDEKRLQSEREIIAASEKLAECQETILNLGKQLKALASPRNSSVPERLISNPTYESPPPTPPSIPAKTNHQRVSLLDKLMADDEADSSNPKEITRTITSPAVMDGNAKNVKVISPPRFLSVNGIKHQEDEEALVNFLSIVPSTKKKGGLLRKLLWRKKKSNK